MCKGIASKMDGYQNVKNVIMELVVFGKLLLICWRAWSLGILLISFEMRDDLIGSTKVDLYQILLKDCFRGNLWDD